MKANFKKLNVEVAFDEYRELDLAKELGNYIHTNTNDIGLDDTARAIYHSDGEMEVDDIHAQQIVYMVKSRDCVFLAGVKRAIINELTNK
jgi:hypothetical protein